MAQTGYTPISIYYSATTTNVPTAGNLVAGELAINTADGKLFYKDSAGAVQVIGTKGGVGSSTTTQVLYNSSGLVVGSANMVFDGTKLTTTQLSSPTIGSASGASLFLQANGTNYVTILGAGTNNSFVGINNTAPVSQLDVVTGGTSAALTLRAYGQSTSTTNNINFWYLDAGGSPYNNASISSISTANAGNGSLAFYTRPTSGSLTEAMRIDSSGNVAINTTSGSGGRLVIAQSNATQPAIYCPTDETTIQGPGTNTYFKLGNNLAINGGGQVSVRTGTTGGVYLSSGATSWTAVSDETTKENFAPIVDAVSKVNSLRAVTGNYINDEDKKSRAFLIAQDVQKVLPEAVNEVDGILGLQYSDVIPLLVASIKELNAKVDAQALEIQALKGVA